MCSWSAEKEVDQSQLSDAKSTLELTKRRKRMIDYFCDLVEREAVKCVSLTREQLDAQWEEVAKREGEEKEAIVGELMALEEKKQQRSRNEKVRDREQDSC